MQSLEGRTEPKIKESSFIMYSVSNFVLPHVPIVSMGKSRARVTIQYKETLLLFMYGLIGDIIILVS